MVSTTNAMKATIFIAGHLNLLPAVLSETPLGRSEAGSRLALEKPLGPAGAAGGFSVCACEAPGAL